MSKKEYIFQKKKSTFTQKLFEKGLTAAGYILIGLKEAGEGFLRELPDSYPGFALMKAVFGVSKRPSFKGKTIRSNLYRLKKQGLIAQDPKEKIYYLTDKGKEVVSYIYDRYAILKQPWDGKLRLVIFDVPERKKHWREAIRKELLLMQYKQLQKSVYIGKYPLAESFCQEMEKTSIAEYVFIFTINKADRKEEILTLLED